VKNDERKTRRRKKKKEKEEPAFSEPLKYALVCTLVGNTLPV
jgi:hypothetical protein